MPKVQELQEPERQAAFWEMSQAARRSPDHPVVRALFEPRGDYLASLVDDPASASVLDVGCGNGFLTVPLDRRFARAVGLDGSQAMLASNPCHEKRQGWATDLPFDDNEFDIAVESHLLHHLLPLDQVKAVREMHRVARRAVVLYEPNRNNPLMFAFGAIKPEERMALKFTRRYVRSLLEKADLDSCSARVEGLIVPNKAPPWWIGMSRMLEPTPLSRFGFYVSGVGYCSKGLVE